MNGLIEACEKWAEKTGGLYQIIGNKFGKDLFLYMTNERTTLDLNQTEYVEQWIKIWLK